MSDYLVAFSSVIAADIKALWVKLNGLTKADVGLGKVDNTADIYKDVRSASKLTTERRIEFSGSLYAYSDLYFNGSRDIKIGVDLVPAPAFKNLYGTNGSYSRPSGDPSPDKYPAGTRYFCMAWNSGNPWHNWGTPNSYIDTILQSDSTIIQTAYPELPNRTPFKGMFIRTFDTTSYNNTANNYKWVPISTNVYTYETTTTETPNVYVGSDGILKRSTNPPKSTVILEGTIGTSANGYTTKISHGLDVNRIKSVTAKVNISANANFPTYVHTNSLFDIEGGSASYGYYFNLRFDSQSVTVSAHRSATIIHGKPVTIFIETY